MTVGETYRKNHLRYMPHCRLDHRMEWNAMAARFCLGAVRLGLCCDVSIYEQEWAWFLRGFYVAQSMAGPALRLCEQVGLGKGTAKTFINSVRALFLALHSALSVKLRWKAFLLIQPTSSSHPGYQTTIARPLNPVI